jgi:hypothetical protein
MAIESQGAKLEISGSSGAAVETMTATAGYPTLLTKENHGLTDGTIGTLSAFAGADAGLMNDKVVTVKYATDDTFCVDIDTTLKTLTAANGTITPLAYLEVGEITDFDGPSGSASVIDTTNLQSTAKEKLMGLPDEGQFSLTINRQPDDAGQLAVSAARKARTEKNFKLTLSDGSVLSFAGYVLGDTWSGGVDGKVSGSITIEISGAVSLT